MAVSFIGASNLITTNGGAPGAITPHASTAVGDLMIWFHYSRATGGNETVTFPGGWTTIFNSVTANNGLVAAAWRIRQSGDTTYTATITNHTSSTTGETVLEHIETYRGQKNGTPILDFTASLSTWASSLNLGSIAAPASASVPNGAMVVVFGGRFENITAQTVLTGDSLTWTNRTLNDTTLGSDAACVTQNGLNSSGSTQTVTAKTITTTGTTQAGAGRMFIIDAEVPVSIAETNAVTDSVAGILQGNISETNAVTDSVSATITQTRYPEVLGTIQKGTTASGTSHVVTLPSGIQAGELLLIITGAKNITFNTIAAGHWRHDTTGTGVVSGAIYYKVADGTESGASITVPTSTAGEVAWMTMRIGDPNGVKKPQLLAWRRSGATAASSANLAAYFTGNYAKDVLSLYAVCMSGTGTLTALSSGHETVDFVTGASGEGGVHTYKRGLTQASWDTIDPDAITFNTSLDYYIHGIVVKFYDTGYTNEPMQGNNGRTTTLQQWFSQTSLTDTNFGRGQSFKASGGSIAKIIAHVIKSNAAQTAGTVVCKIYAHSGTFGTSSVPTGTALATSDSINIADIPVAPNTFGYTCPIEFTFATPFQTTNNTNYVVTIEISGNGDTNPVYAVDGYTSADAGNACLYTAGAWASEAKDYQIELLKEVVSVATIVETNATSDTPTANNATSGAIAETNAISDSVSATLSTSAAIAETNAVTDAPRGILLGAIAETNAVTDTPSSTKSTVAAPITETNGTSDTISSTLATSATIAETNGTSDTPSSTKITAAAPIDETNAVTDTPSSTKSTVAAPITETNAVTDTVNGILLGAIVETNAVTDTVNGSTPITGIISETNAVTDNPQSTLATSAAISETNPVTDTPNGFRTQLAPVSETNAVTDTPQATKATSSAIAETNAVTDTPSGILTGAVTETNPVTDSISAIISTTAAIAETNAVTDTPSATQSTSRNISETNAINDTPSWTVVNRLGTIAETNPVTDTISATKSTSASIAETNPVTDNYLEQGAGAIQETNAITDTVSSTVNKQAAVSETNAVTDTPASTKSTSVSISETNAVTDTPTQVSFTRLGQIQESNPVTDTISSTKNILGTIAETNGTSDDTIGDSNSAIYETNAISDNVSSTKSTSAVIAETNSINETVSSTKLTAAAIAETNSINDSVSATVQKVTSITETNAISDTVFGFRAGDRFVAESASITDIVSATVQRQASIIETVSISDSTSRQRIANGTITETNPVTDNYSAIWEGIAYVRLTVPPGITYVRLTEPPTIIVNKLTTNPTITYIRL